MKIITTLIISSFAVLMAPTKIDPEVILGTELKSSGVEEQANEIAKVLTDAQSLRDLESVLINMKQDSNLTPSSVLAMIESHRKINLDHYGKNLHKGEEYLKNPIYKTLVDRKQEILDAKKAIKTNEILQKEIDRLRKKSGSKSGGGLGGVS